MRAATVVLALCLWALYVFATSGHEEPTEPVEAPEAEEGPEAVQATLEPVRRQDGALEGGAGVEPLPEPAGWFPTPGSPAALLAPHEGAKYEPTVESLQVWADSVPGLDVDWATLTPERLADALYLWEGAREHQALRAFCIGHQQRELERFEHREQSRSLESELTDALPWMQRQFGDSREVWDALNAYSDAVPEWLRERGVEAGSKSDPPSRWVLLRTLAEASDTQWAALVDTLKGN